VGDGVVADPLAGRGDRLGGGGEVADEGAGEEEGGRDVVAAQCGQDRGDRICVGAGPAPAPR
jgi:hypothetical protein